MRRPPGDVHRRLASSMKNSTYNRWSQTVSTVKKSTAITGRLRAEELAPRAPRSLSGRPELLLTQDLLDDGRRHGDHLTRGSVRAAAAKEPSVGRPKRRPLHAAAEHGQLVPQNDDFKFLVLSRSEQEED
jgi:hypothetical protein